MDFAIETNELTKRFGDVVAVNAVDLRGGGEIYGFLGSTAQGRSDAVIARKHFNFTGGNIIFLSN